MVSDSNQTSAPGKSGVLEGVTWYHWLVVIIASCGWLFDCMDQRLFVLARSPALQTVMQEDLAPKATKQFIVQAALEGELLNRVPAVDSMESIDQLPPEQQEAVRDQIQELQDEWAGMVSEAPNFESIDQPAFLDSLPSDVQQALDERMQALEDEIREALPNLQSLEELDSIEEVNQLPPRLQSGIFTRIQGTVNNYGGIATTSMILGWATGGIIFGMFSDKYGRIKAMVLTLFTYTIFTGLSGLSVSWIDFTIYRFLVGLGVGGMFGAATTLVAESVPAGFRAVALGSLQALSATGNILGSLISYQIPPGASDYLFGLEGWRILFFVGLLPIILVVPIVTLLREPKPWIEAKRRADSGDTEHRMGSVGDLFRDPRWRYHTTIGLLFGFAGMVGLWGIGFFSPELIDHALAGQSQELRDQVRALGTAMQDVGSFLGMMTITWVAAYMGRRSAFFFAFLFSFGATIFVFLSLNQPSDAYWMLPIMGFGQLAVFACYSIYFPELFPSRLRGTGVSFCYNTVRYLAAPAPALMGYLGYLLLQGGVTEYFRWAAVIMSFVYVIGIVAIIWAPETKDQPLPED